MVNSLRPLYKTGVSIDVLKGVKRMWVKVIAPIVVAVAVKFVKEVAKQAK